MGVQKGEVVAVMGPNGAGKSTVLKAVMGLAPVVSGRVYWRQRPLAAATHEIVKEGIAFVPQGRRVFTHLTITENLEMGCIYLNDRAEKANRLESVMELFPVLYEKRKDMASAMSGGQQQMLALGRGLMALPGTAAAGRADPRPGPPSSSKRSLKRSRRSANVSIPPSWWWSTTSRACWTSSTRAYVLDKGEVVHNGTPESIRDTDILTQVFPGWRVGLPGGGERMTTKPAAQPPPAGRRPRLTPLPWTVRPH